MRGYNLVAVVGLSVGPGAAANAQGTLDLGAEGHMSGATLITKSSLDLDAS